MPRESLFEIRLRDEGANSQLELLVEQLKHQRAKLDAHFEDQKRKLNWRLEC